MSTCILSLGSIINLEILPSYIISRNNIIAYYRNAITPLSGRITPVGGKFFVLTSNVIPFLWVILPMLKGRSYRTNGTVLTAAVPANTRILYCHHTVGQVCDGSLPNLVFVVLNSPMSKPQLNCKKDLISRLLMAEELVSSYLTLRGKALEIADLILAV